MPPGPDPDSTILDYEMTADGDWQGTWAKRTWLATREDASPLHKAFRSLSVHHTNDQGEVVGSGFRQCNYNRTEPGIKPFTWQSAAYQAQQEVLDTLSDDQYVVSPLVVAGLNSITKLGEQHYSYQLGLIQPKGVEFYKVSDEFLVNSSWALEAPGYIPRGSYNGCAEFGWEFDDETDSLQLTDFNTMVPFYNLAGERKYFLIFFTFQNTTILEQQSYIARRSTDLPSLYNDWAAIQGEINSGTTYVLEEEVELMVNSINSDSVELMVSGALRDGTSLVANGTIYLTQENWIPQ